MKKLYLIFALLASLYASKKEDFLKTLNEVSEIATKTKLNIDKTPSNVEVINRDFIIKSGARTFLDAVKYLPGIEISTSASGKIELIIRGVRTTFRDKIKFLINGHEVTNNLYSNQFYYYNFPASLIKRIEFTKTPDAVMYGDKAYMGVINIITLGDLDPDEFSFYQSTKKQTSLSLFTKISKNTLFDIHYSISDPDVKKVTTQMIDLKNNEVKTVRRNSPNELEKSTGAAIRFKKDNSEIAYRIEYFQKGNFFGIINLPPLKDDRHVNFIHQYLDYHHSKYLSENIKNCFHIGIKHYEWKGAFRIFPVDFNFSNPDTDLIQGARIKEVEYYVSDNIRYNSEKHIANFIIEGKYSFPYDVYYFEYIPAYNNKKTIYGTDSLLKKGIKRKVFSVALEDLYIINDRLSFTYGGRYSNYNDFGDDFSYKLGSVYNITSKTTLKFLFNTAFRAPSWAELYSNTAASFNGNPDLKAEKIKMFEVSVLHSFFKDDKFKITFYRGKSHNFIGREFSFDKEGKQIYENLGDLIIKGYEISYKKAYGKGLAYISFSHNNNKSLFSLIKNDVDYYKFLGSRKNVFKAYNIYNLNNHVSFFTGLIRGSKIKTPVSFDIKSYFSINANINYHNKNSEIIFGVENLTNHPNSFVSLPTDMVQREYVFFQENMSLPVHRRKFYINFIKKWQ